MKIDPALYKKYSKKDVEEAIKILTYHHANVLPKTESDTKPTIYIFRHGQSTDNKDFLFSGWRDVKITEEGEKQALVLADKLENKKLDMLVSSTQTRAIETMELAVSKNKKARDMEIHKDPRIREKSYGVLHGKSKLEFFLKDPEELQKIRRTFDGKVEGGESIREVCERVAEFCDEIIPLMKTHKLNVAISCHGNSIRGFRRYFENLSEEETAKIETPLGQDYAAYVIE
jgi:2,3-bisphosphoglycerate-dependent phosphoglycerate mutase